ADHYSEKVDDIPVNSGSYVGDLNDSEEHQSYETHQCSLRRLDPRPFVGGEKYKGRRENESGHDFIFRDSAQGRILFLESLSIQPKWFSRLENGIKKTQEYNSDKKPGKSHVLEPYSRRDNRPDLGRIEPHHEDTPQGTRLPAGAGEQGSCKGDKTNKSSALG